MVVAQVGEQRGTDPMDRDLAAIPWYKQQVEAIMRAAEAALGWDLHSPVPLVGSTRATVLRCRTGLGSSVVVKAYRTSGLGSFTAEAAGLLLSGRPKLLAIDPATPLIVTADLGAGPSLADLLLGADADAAASALIDWASEYGRLAADTVGRCGELPALQAAYDLGMPVYDVDQRLEECYRALPAVLRAHSGEAPGLEDDFDSLRALRGRYPVFSPGDVCPDNNVVSTGGVQLLDYEGAGVHSAFLDAAYTSMPFSTCWCVFRLPRQLGTSVESAYRAQVAEAHPELRDASVWREGLGLAVAAWTVHATVSLLPRVSTTDVPMHPTRRPVPSARQLLRYRWRMLAEGEQPPALAEMARRLLANTTNWDVAELDFYPAFARSH